MDTWNASIAPTLYRPLEGELPLRLLLLHPGTGSSPLQTELEPTTLAAARGLYDATSYTWGPATDAPVEIACRHSLLGRCSSDGETNHNPHPYHMLRVQRNAAAMLRDLRLPDAPRRVWIDAVCINQCCLDERAAQVARMHRIYGAAAATYVWLGRPDARSRAALGFAARLDARRLVREFVGCAFGGDWGRFVRKTYFFDGGWLEGLGLGVGVRGDEVDGSGGGGGEKLRELAEGTVGLLNRPWFSRVWVQQEASLCRDVRVICGEDVVGWDHIFALAVRDPCP